MEKFLVWDVSPAPLATDPKPSRQSVRAHGDGDVDRSTFRRGLLALPLLLIAILAGYVMDTGPAVPFARVMIDRGELAWEEGIFYRIPILSTLYGVQSLDDIIAIANTFFLPAVYGFDPGSRTQAISFLADGAAVLAIWWLESLRQGDMPWYLQHPSFLVLSSQILGLGVVCPLYCFLSYIYSPSVESMLQGPRSSPMSLLPALLLGYYIPAFAMLFWPDLGERQAWLSVWQLYPVHISVARYVLSLVVIGKPESPSQTPLVRLQRELLLTRVCVGFSVVLGALTWLSTLWSSGLATVSIFAPAGIPARVLPDFAAFCGRFLRWDEVFVFASMFVWLGYVYYDAKRADLVRTAWSDLAVRGFLLTIALGPGAALGLGWLWREEAVAAKREKEALLLEVAAKVELLLKENGA